MPDVSKHKIVYVSALILCIVYLLVAVYSLVPYYTQPYVVADDAGQHIAPLYVYTDHGLPSDDLITRYKLAYLPPGFLYFYRALIPFMDPLPLSRAVSFSLQLLSWLMAYLIGRSLAGRLGGLGAAVLFAHSSYLTGVIYGGLFRSFAPPLILLFIWCWMHKRWKSAFLTLFMQSLIYPPAFLICGGAFGIHLLFHPLRWWKTQRRTLILFAGVALVCLANLAGFARKPEFFGPLYTLKEAREMQEWSRKGGGRFRELPFEAPQDLIMKSMQYGLRGSGVEASLSKRLTNEKQPLKDFILWTYLVVLGACSWKARNWPAWWAGLGVSGIALFFLSRLLAFRFGWPDRFINYSLPLNIILLFPLYASAIKEWLQNKPAAGTVLTVLPVAAILSLYPTWLPPSDWEASVDASEYGPVLEHIKDLPASAHLAGWPRKDMDYVYLFAHKKVLVDHESSHPLYKKYYSEIKKRTRDTFDLYFATDKDTVLRLRDRYSLTHVLLRKSVLSERGIPRLYQPMRSAAAANKKAALKRGLYFTHPPPSTVSYEDDNFLLIDLQALGPPAP